MRSGLGNLVVKEIRELLRDPKILLGVVLMPLLIFPIMGSAINVSTTAVQKSIETASIATLDLDGGPMAQSLLRFLRANLTLVEVNAPNEQEALGSLQGTNTTALVVIPQGFSHNLTSGLRGNIEIYAIFRGLSIAEASRSGVAGRWLAVYESLLVAQTIQQAIPGSNPYTVLDPMALSYSTVLKGKAVNVDPNALVQLVTSQSMMFPMAIMMLLILAMQIAATSIAIEKEEKTLETLLTLPVGRLTILTGKLAGSVVVAAAGAISSIVGVNYYSGTTLAGVGLSGGASSVDLEALGLVPTTEAYLLLGVTIFVTIVSALALAISLAVFTEDVRSAQSTVSFLIMPIVIPSMILMFADMDILPTAVQILLYAIPYTHSIIATKAFFMGDYLTMIGGIGYISLFTVAVLYVAAKIFTSERVLTAKISLRRLRLKR